MNERDRAIVLAIKLRNAKAGLRFNDKAPKVRPTLSPEDRDVIVCALERFSDVSLEVERVQRESAQLLSQVGDSIELSEAEQRGFERGLAHRVVDQT